MKEEPLHEKSVHGVHGGRASMRARSQTEMSTPPQAFATIASTPALQAAMCALDFQVRCTADAMPRTPEEDYFSRKKAEPPYDQLFTVASQASGSVYSLWMSSGQQEHPVVMLGTEGEVAKVGETAAQFLQLALSLAPNWMDCLLRLPGIHGDTSATTDAEYDVDAMAATIASWRGERLLTRHIARDKDLAAQVAPAARRVLRPPCDAAHVGEHLGLGALGAVLQLVHDPLAHDCDEARGR
jgi:hypothetical protein